MDTLNLYYVAFTRAMDHLYIAFEENSKKNNLSSLMVNLIKEHNEYNLDTQSLHLSNPNELCSNDQQIIIDNSINFSINDNSSFTELNKLDDQIQYPSATGFGTFFHDVISKVYDDFSYGYQFLNQKKLSPSIEESFIFKTKEYLDKIQQNASLNFIFQDFTTSSASFINSLPSIFSFGFCELSHILAPGPFTSSNSSPK